MRRPMMAGLVAGMLAGPATAGVIPEVDSAIVTAVDLSSSITRHEEWLQVEGIARAVEDPEFLDAVRRGRHGGIAFAVHGWSSGARPQVLLPWVLIGDAESARAATSRLRAAPRPARFGGGDDEQDDPLPERRLTDLSEGLGFAIELLGGVPAIPERMVLNVLADGPDNVAGGPAGARDAALASGITINGVVIGAVPGLRDYLRDQVIGGFGSFVLGIDDPASFADVMRRKFVLDLVAGATTALPNSSG